MNVRWERRSEINEKDRILILQPQPWANCLHFSVINSTFFDGYRWILIELRNAIRSENIFTQHFAGNDSNSNNSHHQEPTQYYSIAAFKHINSKNSGLDADYFLLTFNLPSKKNVATKKSAQNRKISVFNCDAFTAYKFQFVQCSDWVLNGQFFASWY